MIKPVAALFICFCIFSCNKSIPSGVLKPAKMQAVLWDIVRSDVFTENFIGRDSSKNTKEENIKLQKQVFLQNGVSKEEYYKSFTYYKQHPLLLNTIIDSIVNEVNREKLKQEERVKPVADSVK